MRLKKEIKGVLLIILLLNFLGQQSYGQPASLGKSRNVALTKKQKEQDEKNRNCIKRNRFSAEQRIKFFPFNKATQVKLVSFEGALEESINNELTTIKDTVYNRKFKDIVNLNKAQIDSLAYILYNIGYRGKFYKIEENRCYIPRNAILFVNEKGKVFAFIEICFECNGNRPSSKQVRAGDFCEQKYTLLKEFFYRMGISSTSVRIP